MIVGKIDIVNRSLGQNFDFSSFGSCDKAIDNFGRFSRCGENAAATLDIGIQALALKKIDKILIKKMCNCSRGVTAT